MKKGTALLCSNKFHCSNFTHHFNDTFFNFVIIDPFK